MTAFKLQIQKFNGEEQIQLKQGPGRFNLFTRLSDLWDHYFITKISLNYKVLVGKIDSLAATFTELSNTTEKTWTLNVLNTGSIELISDTNYDPLKAIILIGGLPIPGSFITGTDGTKIIIQCYDSSGFNPVDFNIDFEFRIYN